MKNIFKIQVFFLLVCFCNTLVFASGDSKIILPQQSTQVGSNNSLNTFSTGGVTKTTYYVNQGENSDVIGDYLSGFYYNSLYGFFQLDWSADINKNVRIIGSTNMCNTGYGYKLGGFAKSDTVGLIDFNYNETTFVYYCIDDGYLHGKAFSHVIGYQNFEGISFNILPELMSSLLDTSNDKIFVNNSTTIFSNIKVANKSTPEIVKKESIDYGEESIFYIWKTKK